MKDICPYCSKEKKAYTLKLIPSGRAEEYWPKYVPQIKELCASCERFLRFASQTSELIEQFNDELAGLKVGAE